MLLLISVASDPYPTTLLHHYDLIIVSCIIARYHYFRRRRQLLGYSMLFVLMLLLTNAFVKTTRSRVAYAALAIGSIKLLLLLFQ